MVAGIRPYLMGLAAAAALSMGGAVVPLQERTVIPRPPTTGVVRPGSKRKKDPNDRKRKKPLKAETKGRRLAEALGLAAPRYGRQRPSEPIRTIRMATKYADSRGVIVLDPDKYLHSHARAMKALKRALAA